MDLENLCFAEDGLQNHAYLSADINFDPKQPCFYLMYDNEKLIAFLSTFMPSRDEAEIQAVTHPSYRMQGHFKKLYEMTLEDLKKLQIPQILLEVEAKSTTGNAVLERISDKHWNHSEYRMTLTEFSREFAELEQTAEAVRLTEDTKDVFRNITAEAFGNEEEGYLETIIHSKNRKGYLVKADNEYVGTFVLGYEADLFLYGVVISEKYRGQGLGKQLILAALREELKKVPKAVLEVDSSNPAAFELYKKAGFMIDFQVDYYRKQI